MKRSFLLVRSTLFVLLAIVLLWPVQSVAASGGGLTVTPITWNVVGLDSNNVNVGPNDFPVGARICNYSGSNLTDVQPAFVWDSSNLYIDLRSGSLGNGVTVPQISINNNTCYDMYFEVTVQRNISAYNATRRYHITATSVAEGGTVYSSITPREIYVEHLISQNRNGVTDVKLNGMSVAAGGTMTLMVGNTYTIEMDGFTATQGYNQLESFINFPNTIFQVESVASTYTSNTLPVPLDRLYADACGWENDPTSPNYRTCVGGDYKAGGTVTNTYTVKIISGAGTTQTLNTLLYDFSGSSYHYNSDFSASTRYASIVSASITKSFNPKTIAPNGTSTMTYTISNPGSDALSGVNFTDNPFPSGLALSSSPTVSYVGCGSPTPVAGSLTGGATSLSFTDITIAAFGTCTITVDYVTASSAITYVNTTQDLFINGISGANNSGFNTGSTGSDTLTVSSPAPACTTQTIAEWTIPSTATSPPDNGSGVPTNGSGTAAGNGSGVTYGIDTTSYASVPAVAWYGAKIPKLEDDTVNFSFTLNTSGYTNIKWYFSAGRSDKNSANTFKLFYTPSGGSLTAIGSANTFSGGDLNVAPTLNPYAISVPDAAASSSTVFEVVPYNASNVGLDNQFDLVDIKFTGCGTPPNPPELSKSFSLTSIPETTTSTLTFHITNPNSGSSLSNVSFSDTLPSGLVINTPSSGLTTPSCTSGTLTGQTITAAPGTSTINMSGGTLSAGAVCSFSVNILGNTSGQYENISGNISATESGTNTTSTGYGIASLTVIAPPMLVKSFSPDSIFTHGTSTLTFTITNPNNFSGGSLSGIGFTDTLPGAGALTTSNGTFSPPSHDPTDINPACNGSLTVTGGNSLTYSGGSLAANASCSFFVTVTGNTASPLGGYVNTTSVVTSTEGGNGNTASGSLVVADQTAAIDLNKQVSTDGTNWYKYVTQTVGGNIYYRFGVYNSGYVNFSSISVTDTDLLPVGLDSSTCVWKDSLGSAFSFPLVPGDTAYCVLGPLTGGAVVGTHTNTAQAQGIYDDGSTIDSTQNSATYLGVGPSLGLTKDDGVTSVNAGGTTTYTLTVSNTGTAATSGTITVVDVLPTGLSITGGAVALGGTNAADWSCTASGQVITCTSSTAIAAAANSSFSFTVNVAANASGTLTNPAQVGGGGDPNAPTPTSTTAGECTATDTPHKGCAVDSDTANSPSISVDKTISTINFSSPSVLDITYSIVVHNTGQVNLSNIQVTDDLTTVYPSPASFTVVSETAIGLTTNSAYNGIPSNDLLLMGTDTLNSGSSGTITLEVKVNMGGKPTTYTNTANASGTPPTGPSVTASSSVTTAEFADPAVAKTANPSNASVGDPVIFTITVTNNGTQSANNVKVTDDVPTNFSIDTNGVTSIDQNNLPRGTVTVNTATNHVEDDLGTLATTDVITITIKTHVISSLSNGVTNTANLTTTSSPEPPQNDISSITVNPPSSGGGNGGKGGTSGVSLLPSTGFAPSVVTPLSIQPADKVYSTYGDVWLEIPKLKVQIPIVGVPKANGTWDVTWLGNQAGWLQGSAFPSWNGNSVLTGHVYMSNGLPGPFVSLRQLNWGDQIILHVYGEKYVYQVRANVSVTPSNLSPLQHKDAPWVTLITCEGYDQSNNSYSYRVAVQAMLIGANQEDLGLRAK
jgi:LPXTG-site transpeptidase (sortase) family protein